MQTRSLSMFLIVWECYHAWKRDEHGLTKTCCENCILFQCRVKIRRWDTEALVYKGLFSSPQSRCGFMILTNVISCSGTSKHPIATAEKKVAWGFLSLSASNMDLLGLQCLLQRITWHHACKGMPSRNTKSPARFPRIAF